MTDNNTTIETALTATLRFIVLCEYFYSNGSLLSSLGCHGAPYCSCLRTDALGDNVEASFDDLFDKVCSTINSYLFKTAGNSGFATFFLSVDGDNYIVGKDYSVGFNRSRISLRHAIQLVRDNPTARVTATGNSSYWTGAISALYDCVSTGLSHDPAGSVSFVPLNYNVHCNLSRLWAYQLSIAHYMSNDHIDFVYSAELYRQLIGSYILASSNSYFTSRYNFTRNGITYRYDYLSAHFFDVVLGYINNSFNAASSNLLITNSNVGYAMLGYLSALLGYRRSLRYLDYFTGSRAQPLAVLSNAGSSIGSVNTNVPVVSNNVSVIDITKSIQAQRFLNSVNRVRHSFEDYLKGIFGGKTPAPDYHNPFFVAHQSDVIFGQETENTGNAQLDPNGNSLPIAITTNLRGSGKYMFEIDTDRPCILIGITSYDITRVYQKTMERSFLHLNRFDWFNPFMQYVGDQPIYIQELGINPNSSLASLANFSYTIRHEEFKQRYSQAAGAFCVASTDLDNWIFPALDRRGSQANINPDWIRSLNAEFDRFYVSLTGWSLGTYFHFIVDDFNSVNASRPMAYSPQILG